MKRQRRAPDVARRRILEAAEKQLIEGGPDAVRVQTLARELGMSDAGIHHHFGSRDGLLEALLRFGGRRLRDATESAVSRFEGDEVDLEGLIDLALETFGTRGYSRLALWLHLSGWRDRGSGMFAAVADAFEGAHRSREEARFLAALLVLVLMAEPLLGRAARRSVSLPGDATTARRFRRWLAGLLEERVSEAERLAD